ncbi:MAG: hypothetical protein ABL892_10485 [Thiobacillaceae bacterium]
MMRLPHSLSAWGTPVFQNIFKHEAGQIETRLLPLQQALSVSSHVADSGFSVMVLSVSDDADFIRVKAGILYAGIIAGCSCADDPTPISEQPEYCEVLFSIDKQTAEVTLLIVEGAQ